MSSFKGTLSNSEASQLVARALQELGYQTHCLPIGDGGAGSLSCVQAAMGGEVETFQAHGPMGRPISAKVLCLPNKSAPSSLYVESSEVCGYSLVPQAERDVMRASSRGLGELLEQCYAKFKGSLKKIYVGLGDSAISDAGMGMLSALGYTFLDQGSHSVWGNAEGLRQIRSIQLPKVAPLEEIRFTILCDVLNPLCGSQGSARVFSPQKGASPAQVKLIEQGMENFSDCVKTAANRDIAWAPMSGSAGGLSSAFLAFFRADLVQGARFLFDWIHFDEILEKHAAVITGEGKTDAQSLSGKAPGVCAEHAQKLGKPCIVISGALAEGHEELMRGRGLLGCYASGDKPTASEALIAKTKEVFSQLDLTTVAPQGEPQ